MSRTSMWLTVMAIGLGAVADTAQAEVPSETWEAEGDEFGPGEYCGNASSVEECVDTCTGWGYPASACAEVCCDCGVPDDDANLICGRVCDAFGTYGACIEGCIGSACQSACADCNFGCPSAPQCEDYDNEASCIAECTPDVDGDPCEQDCLDHCAGCDFFGDAVSISDFDAMGYESPDAQFEVPEFGAPDVPHSAQGGAEPAGPPVSVPQAGFTGPAGDVPDLDLTPGGVGPGLAMLPPEAKLFRSRLYAGSNIAPATDGDPVRLVDGAHVIEVEDLHLPGPVRDLVFSRSYDSRSPGRSTLGSNWSHHWDVLLERVTPHNIRSGEPQACAADAECVRYLTSGRETLFIRPLGAEWFVAPTGTTATLHPSDDGWRMAWRDGRSQEFDADGYLILDTDRFGNAFLVQQEETPLYALYRGMCAGGAEAVFPTSDDRFCAVLARAFDGGPVVSWPSWGPALPPGIDGPGDVPVEAGDLYSDALPWDLPWLATAVCDLAPDGTRCDDYGIKDGFWRATGAGPMPIVTDGLAWFATPGLPYYRVSLPDVRVCLQQGPKWGYPDALASACEDALDRMGPAVVNAWRCGKLYPHVQDILDAGSVSLAHTTAGHGMYVSPELPYGSRRKRPVKVTDPVGRTLELSYYGSPGTATTCDGLPTPTSDDGLLASVAGPGGTSLTFTYSRPTGHPRVLNERFLVEVTRHDTNGIRTESGVLEERSVRYEYSWPEDPSGPLSEYDGRAGAMQVYEDALAGLGLVPGVDLPGTGLTARHFSYTVAPDLAKLVGAPVIAVGSCTDYECADACLEEQCDLDCGDTTTPECVSGCASDCGDAADACEQLLSECELYCPEFCAAECADACEDKYSFGSDEFIHCVDTCECDLPCVDHCSDLCDPSDVASACDDACHDGCFEACGGFEDECQDGCMDSCPGECAGASGELGEPAVEGIAPFIAFDWGQGSPLPGGDPAIVTWSGYITVPVDGEWLFDIQLPYGTWAAAAIGGVQLGMVDPNSYPSWHPCSGMPLDVACKGKRLHLGAGTKIPIRIAARLPSPSFSDDKHAIKLSRALMGSPDASAFEFLQERTVVPMHSLYPEREIVSTTAGLDAARHLSDVADNIVRVRQVAGELEHIEVESRYDITPGLASWDRVREQRFGGGPGASEPGPPWQTTYATFLFDYITLGKTEGVPVAVGQRYPVGAADSPGSIGTSEDVCASLLNASKLGSGEDLAEHRDRLAVGGRTICSWARTTDADGVVQWRGLNLFGHRIVEAWQDPAADGGWVARERLDDGDGLIVEERPPVPVSTGWAATDGFTRVSRQPRPESAFEDAASWRLATLATRVERVAPAGSAVDVVWSGTEPELEAAASRITWLEYEPTYGQVARLTEGTASQIGQGQAGQEEALREVRYTFCEEPAPSWCPECEAELDRDAAVDAALRIADAAASGDASSREIAELREDAQRVERYSGATDSARRLATRVGEHARRLSELEALAQAADAFMEKFVAASAEERSATGPGTLWELFTRLCAEAAPDRSPAECSAVYTTAVADGAKETLAVWLDPWAGAMGAVVEAGEAALEADATASAEQLLESSGQVELPSSPLVACDPRRPRRVTVGAVTGTEAQAGSLDSTPRVAELTWTEHGLPHGRAEVGGVETRWEYYDSCWDGTGSCNGDGRGFLRSWERDRGHDDVVFPDLAPCGAAAEALGPAYRYAAADSCDDNWLAAIPPAVAEAFAADTAPERVEVLQYTASGHVHEMDYDPAAPSVYRDADGRPWRIVRGEAEEQLRYDGHGRLVSRYTLSEGGDLLGRSRWLRDEAGEVVTACHATKPGGCEGIGQLSPEEVPDVSGAQVSRVARSVGGRVTSVVSNTDAEQARTYDDLGRLASVTTLLGGDVARRVTATRDVRGRVVNARHEWHDGALFEPDLDHYVETFLWDGFDRLVVHHGEEEYRTVRHYDALDRAARTRLMANVTPTFTATFDASAQPEPVVMWEERAAFDAFDQPLWRDLQGEHLTTYEWGAWGRTLRMEATGAGPSYAVFDAAGRQLWSRTADQQRLQRYAYRDQVAQSITLRGTGADSHVQVDTTTLDAQGLAIFHSREGTGSDGATSEDWTAWSRDALGRVVAVDDSTLELTRTREHLDMLGRSGRQCTGDRCADYRFDPAGRVVELVDPAGEMTLWSWRADGAAEVEETPFRHAFTLSDGRGRPVVHSPYEDRWLQYERDEHGRLTSLQTVGGQQAQLPLQTFSHDALGRVTTATQHQATGHVVSEELSRDALGRLASRALSIDGLTGPTVTHEWDQVSSLSIQTTALAPWFDGQGSTTRVFGTGGQLETIASPQLTALFAWKGDQLTGSSLVPTGGTALDWTQEFDALTRPMARRLTAGPSTLFDETIGRDGTGRISSVTTSIDGTTGLTRQFGYDPFGQLSSESWVVPSAAAATFNGQPLTDVLNGTPDLALAANAGDRTFVRDPDIGSLAMVQTDGPVVPWQHEGAREDGHQLQAVTLAGSGTSETWAITHDDAGRITTGAGQHYSWDALGRLVAVQGADGSLLEAYLWTADGFLAARLDASGGLSTVFARDSSHELTAAWHVTGQSDLALELQPAWSATWGPGQHNLLTLDHADGSQLVAIQSWRRDVVGYVDAADGSLTDVAHYDAHGTVSVRTPTGTVLCDEADPASKPCALPGDSPFGFGGSWRSPQTGLSWMGARWYAPKLAQFLSSDPLGYIDAYDSYGYAAFDPINHWDPSGLASQSFAGGNDPWEKAKDHARETELGDLEFTLTVAGIAATPVPVAGDLVGLGGSATLFGLDPSWSRFIDVSLDALGALPLIPALGTILRSEKLLEVGTDASGVGKLAGRASSGGGRVHAARHGAVTSRAARRQAMREAGTPTSRSAVSQSKVGRQRQYSVEGADGQLRVQSQHLADKAHPKPHWHDASPKLDDFGVPRTNRHGQVKYKKVGSTASEY